jgi:hypothetical protein
MEEIVKVAMESNIHLKIDTLPEVSHFKPLLFHIFFKIMNSNVAFRNTIQYRAAKAVN